VAEARVTLVLGQSEAGKSTLVAQLARMLVERGMRVGVVDADLGQSEIGPPTTIGLGRATPGLRRLADAQPVALHFVGVTSPARDLAATLVGVRRLLDRAHAERFERVLVDTSGLVSGDVGRALKQAKIDLLDPDLVIGLDRRGECDHILRPYTHLLRPAVLILPALAAPRRRSQEDRRRHRARALSRALESAKPYVLDLRRVALRQPALFGGVPLPLHERVALEDAAGCGVLWAERRSGELAIVTDRRLLAGEARELARVLEFGPVVAHALGDLVGALAGFEDEHRETLGLGTVRRFDFDGPGLHVETAVAPERIAMVTIGRENFAAGGR
jgi:polynucleotide 5'-hydroxyl-kinase GRC3/NOL9